MCGIAGISGQFEKEESRILLEGMMRSIAHRGPDANGRFIEQGIALGHQRLSIVDLSKLGNQPMESSSRQTVMTFNGEVYNFNEVKSDLRAINFRSKSDSEVVLEAYEKWGVNAFSKLNGMFTLAFWNRKEKELVLARDRMGIKPLYYHVSERGLVFASEIRALIGTRLFKPTLDPASLTDFLTYQTVHGPKTILQEVKMLPPGHFLRYKDGRIEVSAYWKLIDQGQNCDKRDYSETKAHVRELLSRAVEKRLMSDVPLGAFLSGGIDSSAIVGLMAQASEQAVDTFSIVFNEKEFDESTWSEMVAKKFNTRHHPILLKPEDFLAALPEALTAMDHPSGDGINSYVVAGETRKAGITVALSGLGGDELFAGYPVFKQLKEIQRSKMWRMPPSLRKLISPLPMVFPGGRKGEKLSALLKLSGNRLQDIYPVFRTVFDLTEINKTAPGADDCYNFVRSLSAQNASQTAKMPGFSQVSWAEIRTYTQDVLLRDTDQMSMAHALEVRVPFFDHELVEYVMNIPDYHKNPTYPKKLLVESLGDLLPDEVVHRKKMGFVFPWDSWLKKELKSFSTAKLDFLGQTSWFDGGAIQNLHKGFLEGKGATLWLHIWLLSVLADWMEKNGVE